MNDQMILLEALKLMVDRNSPCFERCYTDGYQSGYEGISEEENPFVKQSKEHQEWQEGWWDGFYGNSPLFELSKAISIEKHDEATIASKVATSSERFGLFCSKIKEGQDTEERSEQFKPT